MAKMTTLLAVFSFLHLFLFVTSGTHHQKKIQNDPLPQQYNCMASKTWCVAKPSSDKAVLQANIDYACSKVDCSCLRSGGPCFLPNNLINQASVAMNMYYKAYGTNPLNCNFSNSGLVTVTDPSFGGCIYPYVVAAVI